MARVTEEAALYTVFAALADETRMQLVGGSLPAISWIHSMIRSRRSRGAWPTCGVAIVTTERHGKWVRYRICEPLPEPLPQFLALLRSRAIPSACKGPACCPETGCEVGTSTLAAVFRRAKKTTKGESGI